MTQIWVGFFLVSYKLLEPFHIVNYFYFHVGAIVTDQDALVLMPYS